MAELRNGETRNDHHLRPGPGFHTFVAVRTQLSDSSKTRVTSNHLRRLCAELGIELYPLVRKEWYMTKVYKRQIRWLTDEEVERIMALFHVQLEAKRARYVL